MALHRANPLILRPGVRRLDSDNPLSRAAVIALPMDGAGNSTSILSQYDYAQRQFTQQVGSGFDMQGGIGIGGRCMIATDASKILRVSTDAAAAFGTTTAPSGITVAIIRRKTDATLRNGLAFTIDDPVSSRSGNHILVYLPFFDGTVYWDCGSSSSGSGRLFWGGYSSFQSTNVEYWIFTAGGAASRGHDIWLNGVQRAINGADNAVYAPVVGDHVDVNWLQSGSGSTGDAAEFYQVHVCKRQWTEDECHSWFADPWQMYEDPFSWRKPRAAPAGGASDTLMGQAVFA